MNPEHLIYHTVLSPKEYNYIWKRMWRGIKILYCTWSGNWMTHVGSIFGFLVVDIFHETIISKRILLYLEKDVTDKDISSHSIRKLSDAKGSIFGRSSKDRTLHKYSYPLRRKESIIWEDLPKIGSGNAKNIHFPDKGPSGFLLNVGSC